MNDQRRTPGPRRDNDHRRSDEIEEAVDLSVKKVFAILGVDVDDPKSIEEFREDLRFGKRLRRAADRGFLALVSAIFVACAAATWAGITGSRITGGH